MSYGSSYGNSCVLGLLGHNSFTSCFGQLVLNIFTRDFGDSVAVLHLHGDLNNLGVVHTMLSSDLTASMFHCFSDGVGNCVSYRGRCRSNRKNCSNRSMSNWSKSNRSMSNWSSWGNSISSMVSSHIKRISFGISSGFGIGPSFPLGVGVSTSWSRITDYIHNLSTDLLIFNLLCVHSFSGANLLSIGSADMCDQDDVFCYTFGGWAGVISTSVVTMGEVKWVSLGISFSSGGSSGERQKAGDGDYLHHDGIE